MSEKKTRRVFLKMGAATLVAATAKTTIAQSRSAGSRNNAAQTHEYDFTTSAFEGSPDGRAKELWGYNKQFPGPEIRVKEGDTIRVRVNNQMAESTSIHWHGMKQRGTWQMDGVTPISRPPIEPGESFVYEFKAEPAGTHWYHSHTGVQYSDGLYGPLVVEAQSDNYEYDRDQVLMIGDWFVEPSAIVYEKIQNGTYRAAEPVGDGTPKPDYGDVPFESFLFNGKGVLPNDLNGDMNVFKVKKGETIRFRIINSSSTYTFKLQFDRHQMKVIETDGQAVAPVITDCMTIDIGERVDVLVTANHSGSHYIRAATMDGKMGMALLQYEDDPVSTPAMNANWGAFLSTASLVAPSEVNLPAQGHKTFELSFKGSRTPYAWPINGKSYPDAPPIMVSRGESIRLIMKNPTGMSHPFHIHGHYFRVLGRPGELNLVNPALKDSITVPAQDEMVVQFDADNPGNWFFHCHIEWHLGIGMGLVIRYQDV